MSFLDASKVQGPYPSLSQYIPLVEVSFFHFDPILYSDNGDGAR